MMLYAGTVASKVTRRLWEGNAQVLASANKLSLSGQNVQISEVRVSMDTVRYSAVTKNLPTRPFDFDE